MKKKLPQGRLQNLPACAIEFIKLVIKKMRYRKKVRADVQAELSAHFEDELKDCKTDDEKQQKAQQLIEQFGDVKLLATLLRRAKKRCRPLWRTIFARACQTIVVLTLCFIVYVAWFLTGKPVITTNYVAKLNQIVRPVADESLNAAPLYEKAIELFDDPNDYYYGLFGKKYYEVQSEEKQQIKQCITDNKEIFNLVKAGTNKPYHWQQYKGDEMIAILMPHLSGFKKLANVLIWRAQLHAEKGQYEDALDDIKSCYRMGQHLRGDKILIEQLVGMSIEAISFHTLRDILSRYTIDSDALTKLQSDFERIIADEDFTVTLKAEKLFMYDEIQRCFTEDRLGGGHLYVFRVNSLGGSSQLIESSDMISLQKIFEVALSPENWKYAPRTLFFHPNRKETRQTADRIYAFWEELAHKTPARIRAENVDVEKEIDKLIKGNLLLEILTPAFNNLFKISYQIKVDVEATITIISLLRYKNEKTGYPVNLEELITAEYLESLPIDPFSDKPLVYKKTDDGFTLYSVGHNFTDNDGKPGRDKKGRPRLWRNYDGDAVFWPVQR